MPAKNPRIAVIVPKSVHATVRRLAGLRGVSVSAVVREFLVETEPVLQRVANLMDAAARADKSALQEWAGKLSQAQDAMEVQGLAAMAKLDDLQGQLPLRKAGRPVIGTAKPGRRSRPAGRVRSRKPSR